MTMNRLIPPRLGLLANSVVSSDGWAMYPNFGRRDELRYEEFSFEGLSQFVSEPTWSTNHVLVIDKEFGVGRQIFLGGSKWKWECPFDGEVIEPDKRVEIIKRLRAAWEFNGYSVHTDDLEIAAGLRVPPLPQFHVRFVDSNMLQYSEGEFCLTVPVRAEGDSLIAKIGDVAHWDSPNHRLAIDAGKLGDIVARMAAFAAKSGKNFVLSKH